MAKLVSSKVSEEQSRDWHGTLSDFVIEKDGVQVQGVGITYLDCEETEDENGEWVLDPVYLNEVFEEWKEYAEAGEEGYTIL